MGRPRIVSTEIEDMFHDGYSAVEMARQLGLPEYTVYNRLRASGLSITERDHDLRPGTVREQSRSRTTVSMAGHNGTQRYRELERIAKRYGSVEMHYCEGEYTAFVGVHEGAAMSDIEAAIDSAIAVATEGDVHE
jgi:hypothetical protein